MRTTPLQTEVRRYQRFRHVARIVSALAFGRRKQVLESLLLRRFGNVVEAQGHLLEVDPGDRAVGARLRRRGIWSEAETELCRREIRPGMTVLDIGANLGYFSLLFAGAVGPEGRVFAFEPDPYNLQLLQQNVERNGYSNVTIHATALGRVPGMALLYKNSDNLGDHRLGHGGDGRVAVEVPVVSLDSLAEKLGRVDFIKMDIQGSEAAVVAGGTAIFMSERPLRLVCEFWPDGMRALGDDPHAHLERLHGAGFAMSVLARGKRLRLLPLETEAERRALCERGGEVNLFCVRG